MISKITQQEWDSRSLEKKIDLVKNKLNGLLDSYKDIEDKMVDKVTNSITDVLTREVENIRRIIISSEPEGKVEEVVEKPATKSKKRGERNA